MTSTTKDPSPDLFDICVVLNEATDAPLGADLLPFAKRVKTIVLDALIAEAERGAATVSAFGHDGTLAEYLRHRQGGDR